MAAIKPFRAWRYHPSLLENIGDLTSPLFDVASEKQREALDGNSLNSIHLSIPRGGPTGQPIFFSYETGSFSSSGVAKRACYLLKGDMGISYSEKRPCPDI